MRKSGLNVKYKILSEIQKGWQLWDNHPTCLTGLRKCQLHLLKGGDTGDPDVIVVNECHDVWTHGANLWV